MVRYKNNCGMVLGFSNFNEFNFKNNQKFNINFFFFLNLILILHVNSVFNYTIELFHRKKNIEFKQTSLTDSPNL